MKVLIQQKTSEILEEAIAIREHLHANPELSFQEFKTSEFVKEKLTAFGIPYISMADTGVVGSIEADPNFSWIALRADLDALPIQEKNEVSYRSNKEGIMHACGHDVHTTMLLGAAKILNSIKDQLKVNIKLIFQPGEEKLPGGASLMIKDGVLEQPRVDKIFALHVFPELEAGKVGLKSGMYMASCDEIYITVNGKGGHGAMPEQNIDPIAISAQLITALQQVVSRKCPPQIPSVLSFGRIEGLGATNVIPDKVELQGTFRTMNEEWRATAHTEITKITNELCQSFGAHADVKILVGYPYLENDPQLTENSRKLLGEHFGEDNVVDLPLRMTGEDFAFYSQKIPATFIRIGVRNESKGIVYPVHNAKFDIDNKSIAVGIETLVHLCLSEK